MLSIPGPHSGNLEYNQQKFCVACPEQLLKQCLQETTMIAVIIHCFVKKIHLHFCETVKYQPILIIFVHSKEICRKYLKLQPHLQNKPCKISKGHFQ